MHDFCDALINAQLDILWCDCARADNLDKELLVKMRKAGCIRLVYGMETASQKLLDHIEKKINLKRLEEILRWTDEAGIWTGIEVISGLPFETDEDVQATIEFVNNNDAYIDTVYNNMFWLTSGSRFYKDSSQYGIKNISCVDTFEYDRIELKGSTRNAFDEEGGKPWKEKLPQIINAFDRVVNSTNPLKNYFPGYELEHLLFYLYRTYKEKPVIQEIFRSVYTEYAEQKKGTRCEK